MSLALTTISLRTKRFVLKKVVARAYEQKEGKNVLIDVTRCSICLIYSIRLKVYQNERVNMPTFEDKTLAELVRKYKVLYDKAHPEFHRKDIKNNACKEVAEALGTDGKIIKNCFCLHYNPFCFCFHLGNW